MTWVLAAVLLLWLACGPLVLLLAAALLAVPRVRWWAQDHWNLSRRGAGLVAAAAVVVTAVVVVVPDGWLPVPPAPGALAMPSYVGRPADPRPLAVVVDPPHPRLAASGRDPAHHARGGSTSPWAGPTGLQPQVDTAWFGLEHCPRPAFDSRDRLVVTCRARSGPALHVVDAGTMRKVASRDLPDPTDDDASHDLCAATPFFLDERDRAVVATADRHVVALRTADGRGDPELSVDQEWDLRPWVPHGDCLVALMPDWAGRLWWASRAGLVGTIAPEGGEVGVHDLGEVVAGSFAVDAEGVLLASEAAVHRLVAGPDGTPQPAWGTPYGAGGGPASPHGTTPALLDGGQVAVTTVAEGRTDVVFLDRGTGAEICRQPVFEVEDGSAAGGELVPVGDGVVVANHHGYDGPRSTLLGFTPAAGLARVDLVGGECRTSWTSDRVSPSGTGTVSVASGLVYAYTKRPSLTGVSAWYLTALDAATGRAMWSVRTGTGVLANNHHAAVVVGPDETLWAATLSGLVRLRDRD